MARSLLGDPRPSTTKGGIAVLDTTYLGLTASDWRMLAVVIGIFAGVGIASAIRDHRPRRGARTADADEAKPSKG